MIAMKVEIENAAIELDPAQSLRLKGAAGVRIVCRSGTVWVTQEGVLRDEVPAERDAGMTAGWAWMAAAEAVVVYVDLGISAGMRAGIQCAEEIGMPVEYRSMLATGGPW